MDAKLEKILHFCVENNDPIVLSQDLAVTAAAPDATAAATASATAAATTTTTTTASTAKDEASSLPATAIYPAPSVSPTVSAADKSGLPGGRVIFGGEPTDASSENGDSEGDNDSYDNYDQGNQDQDCQSPAHKKDVVCARKSGGLLEENSAQNTETTHNTSSFTEPPEILRADVSVSMYRIHTLLHALSRAHARSLFLIL